MELVEINGDDARARLDCRALLFFRSTDSAWFWKGLDRTDGRRCDDSRRELDLLDRLRGAVFGDLEIGWTKIQDRAALSVGDDGVNLHRPRRGFGGGRRLRGGRCRAGGRRVLGRQASIAGRHDERQRDGKGRTSAQKASGSVPRGGAPRIRLVYF